MLFSEFPFLRYSFFFIGGILLYPALGFLSEAMYHFLFLILFLLYSSLIAINYYSQKFNNKGLLPVIAYSMLILMGSYFTYSKDIRNNPEHLSQQMTGIQGYMATVLGMDEQKANSVANRVSLMQVYDGENLRPMVGEILIYHRIEGGLQPGEVIYIQGNPQKIDPATNPGEFDYRKFMLRQQISHQHFINDRFHRLGRVNEQPIENFFLHVRARILAAMNHHIQDPQANQVAKALLLGQKKNMDKELSNAYAATGAMHILAVSGLHVGIVYGFFFLFIKPYRLPVRKRIVYLSFIILLIWGYAFLTGMSPSVMRAATMFSLMALAQMKSRNPSIFNAIALSALILLIYDPFLIYAVGFQLSYMALLGILLFQPLLVKIWMPKNKILEYGWQISTVGIAAQLATFPISVYYFHIFPTYFILSNLIAIPGAFLIMSFGVPFMVLAEVPFLSGILASIVEFLIKILNGLIFYVHRLPNAQISDIQLDDLFIPIYILVLAMLYLLTVHPKKWQVYVTLITLFVFGISQLARFGEVSGSKELIVYDTGEGLAVDFIPKNVAYYWQSGVKDNNLSYKVLPNRKEKDLQKVFALQAFGKADSLTLYLPDVNGEVSFTNKRLLLSQNLEIEAMHRWVEGEWKVYESLEPISIEANALKLTLK
jgi:competence protein ComEC